MDYLRSFFDVAPSNPTPYPPNQSVFGFWLRLLTANEFSTPWADLSGLATLLSYLSAGALVLLTAYLTWPRQTAHWKNTFALGIGLVLVTFSLIVPTSWYHHFAVDLIPLLLAWFAMPRRALRAWRAALLVAYGFIGVQGLLWKSLLPHTLLLSLATYGLLIIYAALATRVQARQPNPATTLYPAQDVADAPRVDRSIAAEHPVDG